MARMRAAAGLGEWAVACWDGMMRVLLSPAGGVVWPGTAGWFLRPKAAVPGRIQVGVLGSKRRVRARTIGLRARTSS
ncbi:hypothetical protein ACE1SV_60670 [Streptomyces sennicomposti]